MARITYTYTYKNYPDCDKATKLSKFWNSPNKACIMGMIIGFAWMMLGGLFYNLVGDSSKFLTGVISVVFLVVGFAVFIAGTWIIPAVFNALKISDRVYEKETGKKIIQNMDFGDILKTVRKCPEELSL